MSPAAEPAALKRLGELLTRRRVELDSRYQNRTVFAAERGIDYRLAYDIEEARRGNFRTTTLTAIANAYAVTAESLFAVLRGAAALEPVPGPARSDAVRKLSPPADEDPTERLIRRILEADEPSRKVLKIITHAIGDDGQLLPWPERLHMVERWLDGTPRPGPALVTEVPEEERRTGTALPRFPHAGALC